MYCIYKITNLINGKTYIGQHKYKELDDYYMGSGKHLINAQKKYGIKNFKKEILIFNVAKKEHIDLLEKTFIASEREKVGVENCYNITDGGGGGSGPMSEEHKMKISKANKGKHQQPRSEETRKKMSKAQKGKHHSEAAKKKMSEAHKGKSISEEARKKLSKAHKGKSLSEEARKNMSKAQKGKHLSEAHRRKLSEAHKGHQVSDETRKKISETNKISLKGNQCHKGCHHSEEARKKMSAAWDYDKHCTEERRKKQSETFKTLRWFNNGERSIRAKECPEGFVPGRLRK